MQQVATVYRHQTWKSSMIIEIAFYARKYIPQDYYVLVKFTTKVMFEFIYAFSDAVLST